MDRNWWKSAEEEIEIERSTQAALDRNLEARRLEARAALAAMKPKPRKRTSPTLEKMHPIKFYVDLLGFEHETLRVWCRDSKIRAHFIQGQWRIPESAMKEFIESQDRKRA